MIRFHSADQIRVRNRKNKKKAIMREQETIKEEIMRNEIFEKVYNIYNLS
tara:strand:+ start:776 stop:925 length:150 start_codon:yes stop_codon:yes gene_type:complete